MHSIVYFSCQRNLSKTTQLFGEPRGITETAFYSTQKLKKMKTIIAFGNPLLDITVNINNNLLLTKYDLKPDGAKEVEKHVMANLLKDIEQYVVILNELYMNHLFCYIKICRCDQYLSAGGCAQNTIRVIQWLLEKKCNVFMFGSVGNDKEAIKMRQLLENDGIQTR